MLNLKQFIERVNASHFLVQALAGCVLIPLSLLAAPVLLPLILGWAVWHNLTAPAITHPPLIPVPPPPPPREKAAPEFVLIARDRKALEMAEPIFAVTPDPLALMNDLARWPEPPPYDGRWIQKLGDACEIAAAYAKLAHNYKLAAERARHTSR
jgi:hypothetical protein